MTTFEAKCLAFLRDLTALSHIHGIEITACGCCDSPFLTELKDFFGKYTGEIEDEGDALNQAFVNVQYVEPSRT